MQYQSIIRFFEYSGIDYGNVDGFNLSRAKKLIAAEFAMQADGIIVVDGCSYTKQDVLSELERPDFLGRLQFHIIIWEHKGLLTFLEQDRFDFKDGATWYSLSDMPGFVSFISPYFSVVYNRVMRSFLNSNDLNSAARWLDYLYFVEAADEEEALRNTRIYLNDIVRFFRNLNDTSFKSRDKELRLWYTTSWSNFMNKLPDSLLSYVDEIVSAIINFTVRIQKSGKKICYKISKELLKVNNANYSLLQLIRSNHEAYAQNYKGKTFTGWLKSGVNIVYVIMIVIFAVSRLFLSGSDDSDYNSGYVPYYNRGIRSEDQEIMAYRTVRNLYRANYGSYEHGFYMSRQTTSEAFDAKETYLLVEAAKDTGRTLSPFSIVNNTADTIQFHMLRGNYISHFDMAPDQNFSFKPLPFQTVDMFIELGSTGSLASIPFSADNNMHSLHIGIQDTPNDTSYVFNDSIITEMPYFNITELTEMPLVIGISKKEGKYYFDLKGQGNIVFQKGSDDVSVSKK